MYVPYKLSVLFYICQSLSRFVGTLVKIWYKYAPLWLVLTCTSNRDFPVPANTHSLGWAHDRPAAIDFSSWWCRRLTLAAIMFVARSIAADHKDLIHDVSYDFHGRRMATCSSDQSVKVISNLRDVGSLVLALAAANLLLLLSVLIISIQHIFAPIWLCLARVIGSWRVVDGVCRALV